MQKFLVVLVMVLLVTMQAYPLMVGNESGKAYGGGGGESTSLIDRYVIESGGYFLQANSDILKFLSKVEMSELSGADFAELAVVLDEAIANMEKAREAYTRLTAVASLTPYNYAVISQLATFDYAGFQKDKGLTPSIFRKVNKLLAKGNVLGIYTALHNGTSNTLDLLYGIKADVDNSVFPASQHLWQVNRVSSELMLFGQYTAEVFYAIK
ncbi:MAG: hypothetical protein GY765_18705 [bacterium]|nr:hypothetical protein [bacterium]